MPKLSIYFLRAAVIHLVLGFTFGALLLANKGVQISPIIWLLLPAHQEFLLMGWTVQLALGVAFWILPRFGKSRGNERPAWLSFLLLNLGVWLIGLQPLLALPNQLLLVGRLLETAGALAFAIHAWPRIKPVTIHKSNPAS